MAEPAGTAKEKMLFASILGPLGAAPAPAQSRLCAGSQQLPCTQRDWRVAALCQHCRAMGTASRHAAGSTEQAVSWMCTPKGLLGS